jgi:tripeptide aminopeptidase
VSASADATARGIDALERRYLSGTFAELCRIESPSGRERRCAERVIAELRPLEVEVHEDDAGARVGSDCGNLLVRIPAAEAHAGDSWETVPPSAPPSPATGRSSLLLCAHLDTVPLQAPVEPVLVDGFWENANAGVLGADNKAAVAVLLALARHVRRAGAAVDLELLFTVREETGLAGARAFDVSRLRSELGFVFDHATPIGELIVESPTHFRLDAAFRGAAAHAGVRPEEGRSAILAAAHTVCTMQLGRVDPQSTVNVGTISGGSAMNVVPEHCSLLAEVRSLDAQRAEELAGEIVDRAHEAANMPACECDVEVSVQRTFGGYRLPPGAAAVQIAETALRSCGHEPVRVASGGASDANALVPRGLEVVNLANGTERNHEPGERVSALALQQMLDVAIALLDAAAMYQHPAR